MRTEKLIPWNTLEILKPTYAFSSNVDLVVLKLPDDDPEQVVVMYGRCQHRGALMSDAHIHDNKIVCGLHGSHYIYKTGINPRYINKNLQKFKAWIEDGFVCVDAEEIAAWEVKNPQKYQRDQYQGLYADSQSGPEEPNNKLILELARNGLKKFGHHGPTASMGVPFDQVPKWDDIQLVTAQLWKVPLLDDAPVATEVIIGKNAKKPLKLDIPIFVSDMSFGALSQEAKIALAQGAELSGTGICSGEGGMLAEEQAANSRYFYELASGRFGYDIEKVKKCQAFHFKGGQAAKTGTGGHLPGEKVKGKIAEVRHLPEGQAAISPSTFPDWTELSQYKDFANYVREETGGIPIGYKLSAQHIERDIDAALSIGVDYIILDGRGGGTGAAPTLFRDNISVPTIPALARARRHLDRLGRSDISLVITGGLRVPADFIKALALGADAIAISNSAMQAIGCLGMRACQTNDCPVGVATQQDHLRRRLEIDKSAQQLHNFLSASIELMQVMARACGHHHLNQFSIDDLTTWKKEMHQLTGIHYGGIL
ncbi:glutamate synthase-related protein [Acinetobacter shaoyimingii]|uniref:Rieske 2Fe-2S domain-containing protein n=1 Tax=Acinetobacter shaoyimingii TaxID=2715164 RepID=A0A6G8RSZ3_9GAMM|nr:glutamate synthase-related protein [Acinetobacter shaoyimingii]NHB56445.1 Rieske 2Fe-2S domain-containing protein [Acinetobacter shaoyimingii]QIO05052.1 Rieske 2Fe-2S domain-containing protein [Acinetobacter shaoyimingii]